MMEKFFILAMVLDKLIKQTSDPHHRYGSAEGYANRNSIEKDN